MRNKLSFSVSIVIIGIIIALGILIVRGNLVPTASPIETPPPIVQSVTLSEISTDDHILGSPNAPVTIIEYSDLGCPFCASFHETMLQVMDSYGSKGLVNWVYRHFPNTEAHPLSKEASIYAECLASIENENAFWEYIKTIFELQRSDGAAPILTNEKIDEALKPYEISEAGKELCTTYNHVNSKVDKDHSDGLRLAELNPSEFGTPYIILISKNGTTVELTSSIPHNILREYIELLLLDI